MCNNSLFRKRCFVLAIAATMLASTQTATSGEICENNGFNVCQQPSSTLTTNNQGINTGTGSVTTTNVTASGTVSGTTISGATGNITTVNATDLNATGSLDVTGATTLNGGLDMAGNPITNLAPGIDPGDAVNMSQLSSVRSRVNRVEDEATKGISIANAMEVFLPDPDKVFRVTVGAGFYDDEQAVGITGAGRVHESTALFFGVGSDVEFDEVGGKVGVSFQW